MQKQSRVRNGRGGMLQSGRFALVLFAAVHSDNNRSASDTARGDHVFLVSDQIGEKHEDHSNQAAEIHFSRAAKVRKINSKNGG